MKATLEFNLDDPDDRMSHLRCVKSLDMALALWHISYDLKKQLYRKVDEDSTINLYDLVDFMVDTIREKFDDHNINLDELIV